MEVGASETGPHWASFRVGAVSGRSQVLRNYQLQYSPLRVVALPSGDTSTLAPWDADLNSSLAGQARAVSCVLAAPDGRRLFICHRAAVRAIDLVTAAVTTVAGSPGSGPTMLDGPCATARFAGPEALALAPDGGTLYIIDALPVNQYFAVRAIAFDGGIGGGAGCQVRTLVSDRGKVVGAVLADGPAAEATLGDIWSLAVPPGGLFVYAISYTYACVRAISTATGYVTTYTGRCSLTSAGDTVGAALAARYSVPENILMARGGLYIHDKGNRKVNHSPDVSILCNLFLFLTISLIPKCVWLRHRKLT